MLINPLQIFIWIVDGSNDSLPAWEWIVLSDVIPVVVLSGYTILCGPECVHISHDNITVLFEQEVVG